jgi:hypothetical protein
MMTIVAAVFMARNLTANARESKGVRGPTVNGPETSVSSHSN